MRTRRQTVHRLYHLLSLRNHLQVFFSCAKKATQTNRTISHCRDTVNQRSVRAHNTVLSTSLPHQVPSKHAYPSPTTTTSSQRATMLHKSLILGLLVVSLHGVPSHQTQSAQTKDPSSSVSSPQHVASPPQQQPASAPVVRSAVAPAAPAILSSPLSQSSQPKVTVKSSPVPIRTSVPTAQQLQPKLAKRIQPFNGKVLPQLQPGKQGPAAAAPVPLASMVESMLNQYNGQFGGQKASYNSLLNSIVGSFSNRMSKRSGKISPLDSALYNVIPDSTGNAGGPELNLNNLNAINDMISTAMNTMNGGNGGFPGQAMASAVSPGLINSIGSFFSSNLGKSKRILDLPKQLYKSIGERITGAGEAAVSATVPIKDSFLSTFKSFVSYLKPSRSSQADSNGLSAFTGQDASNGANSGSGYSGLNFKRRQSYDMGGSQPYPYFAQGNMGQQGNQRHQQQQAINWAPPPQQQWNSNWNNFQQQQPKKPSSNVVPQHSNSAPQHSQQQHLYGHQQQQPQHQQAPQYTQMGAESVRQPQFNAEQFAAAFAPSNLQQFTEQFNEPAPQLKAVPYGTRMVPMESQVMSQHQHPGHQQGQHGSGLYARSKEIFNKIARKAARSSTPAPMAQFPGQFLGNPQENTNQLPSQILSKVQSKLGTLPSTYNQQQQQQVLNNQQPQQQQQQPQQQQQQQPSGQGQSPQWVQQSQLGNQQSSNQQSQNQQQQPASHWAQSQGAPSNQQQQPASSLSSFFTQEPSQGQQIFPYQQFQPLPADSQQQSQIPLSSQSSSGGQYLGQMAGTVASSSTPASVAAASSVVTSVSISQSISSSHNQHQQQQAQAQAHLGLGHQAFQDEQPMGDQSQDAPQYYYDGNGGGANQHDDQGSASDESSMLPQEGKRKK